MLRFLFKLLGFKSAKGRQEEVRRDMRSTHNAYRAKADVKRDFFLDRDLAELKDKDKQE